MKFFKQIKFEIRNIMKSKFLFIIGILVLVYSLVIPIMGLFTQVSQGGIIGYPGGRYYEKAMASSYVMYDKFDGNQESITVEGITITSDNPFYWNILSITQEKDAIEVDKTRFSSSEALDLVIAMMDDEMHYYLKFAQFVTKPQDYRAELAWISMDNMYDKFVFEHFDVDKAILLEAYSYRRGMDQQTFDKKFIDITAEERQAAYIKADETLTAIFAVVENNDFPKYIDLKIQQENINIASMNENIAIQEEAIKENPSQEESLNQIIEDYKKQIKLIETNNIPLLQYRLEKGIIPGEDLWQNSALSDIENNRSQLVYTTILSEEKYNKETYLVQQYGSYQKYVNAMQKQINEMNNTILIAQKSLDSDKPDMKYVSTGSRYKTVQFLDYSVIVALFAILIGGWIMASEFQQGTIRLLMIRPKTRTKILMSKFIAAFAVCLAIYLAGSVLNVITNGICYGFSDFAFPNYTIAGEVSFIAYYVPKLLLCITSIIFAFAVAFMLSVVVKNIAVSIAIPIVCFIGCTILMTMFSYSSVMQWVAYTPIPYVQISSFFTPYSVVQQIMTNGVPLSMPYGIMLLLVLSAACVVTSILVFKKRDITN